MWKPGKMEILFTEIVKRISHSVRINWKSFTMKFWLRTTLVWFKPFAYVWKSFWVKIPNCCTLSLLPKDRETGNANTLESKPTSIWLLIVLGFFFCYIWSHSLTALQSTGFFCPWFGQDGDFTHCNHTEICVAAEFWQSWAQIRRKRWLWGKFWGKEPSPVPWLSGCCPTSAALFAAEFWNWLF